MALQLSEALIAKIRQQAEQYGLTDEEFLRAMLEASEGSLPVTGLRYVPRIIESINEAFIALDRNMIVTYINHRAEVVLRRSRDELIGRHIWASFPEAVGTTFDMQYRHALQTGEDVSFIEYYPPLEAWFEVRAYPSEMGLGIFFVDVSRSQQAEMKLRESEARYRGIVESQIDLVCRYTPDTILTFANYAYCEFFRQPREALVGRSFLGLGLPESEARIRARIADVLKDPKPAVAEYSHVGEDGRARWVQWVDYGIVDENGQVTEIQAVGREVTRLHELELDRLRAHELEIELKNERELVELKERFIAMVSHEFRTPLAVILSSVDIIRRYYDRLSPERIGEKLDSVALQARSLIDLLNELLVLSRAHARHIEFNPKPVDLFTVCNNLLENIRLLDNAQHRFVIHMDEQARYVMADQRLLEHILQNVLTNAVKYSPPHTDILFRTERVDDEIQFVIQDHGIGIPQNDQPLIFQSFHRAQNAYEFEGTGLGLAIARLSAEAHGGEIDFDSEEGAGTTFYVRLPYKSADGIHAAD